MPQAAPRPAAVIVLAAGQGTRMRSRRPKVLHEVAGRTLLGHVLAAAAALDPERTVVVVGHGRDEVRAHLAQVAPAAVCVVQEVQRGTGHAVRIALEAVGPLTGSVVVLAGDTPLLRGETLVTLAADHLAAEAGVTVLTAVLEDPAGYGRIVRGTDGTLERIVEDRDADAATRAIREINSGMYVFDGAALGDALAALTAENAQGEEYLTDAVGILRARGVSAGASVAADAEQIRGVNDRVQLAEAGAILRSRIADTWMRAGVTIVDPASTWIDSDAQLAPDVTLLPDTSVLGPTVIAEGARIGPGTTLVSCEVGADAHVRHTWAELAVIGPAATVGPYTYLRPGTVLGADAKAGAFVEIKNSTLGAGAKVPHLSYVGDAEIGEGSNVGAATVVVNYDGQDKHRTVIGDHVRIGSDTMLVAPVRVGDGAYTAAGSVITDDVPPGAMAVGRARQRNIPGWVARRRPGSAAAEAAQKHDREPDDVQDGAPGEQEEIT